MRVTIEHSYEGTTASFAKDDLTVRGIVKAAGFRWSGREQVWYLNSRWAEPTRRQRAQQVIAQLEADEVELIDGGRAPQLSAAEREEQQRERAAERAERLDDKAARLTRESDARHAAFRGIADHIPFGQPILVGHHSERRARRDIDRMRSHMDRSVEAQREAEQTAERAETARRTAEGTSPLTRLRRIERKSAELRDIERRIAKASSPASAEYRERMEVLAATLRDEIAHDQAQVEASGRKVFTKADVAKGDVVIARGTPRRVVRVNAKSVSVETGYSWTDTVPYIEITRVVKADAA